MFNASFEHLNCTLWSLLDDAESGLQICFDSNALADCGIMQFSYTWSLQKCFGAFGLLVRRVIERWWTRRTFSEDSPDAWRVYCRLIGVDSVSASISSISIGATHWAHWNTIHKFQFGTRTSFQRELLKDFSQATSFKELWSWKNLIKL